jgi:hypothetical protein
MAPFPFSPNLFCLSPFSLDAQFWLPSKSNVQIPLRPPSLHVWPISFSFAYPMEVTLCPVLRPDLVAFFQNVGPIFRPNPNPIWRLVLAVGNKNGLKYNIGDWTVIGTLAIPFRINGAIKSRLAHFLSINVHSGTTIHQLAIR